MAAKSMYYLLLWFIFKILCEASEHPTSQLAGLDASDVQQLLRDDEESNDEKPRDTIAGYPTYPLYRDIGTMLDSWANSGYGHYVDVCTIYMQTYITDVS